MIFLGAKALFYIRSNVHSIGRCTKFTVLVLQGKINSGPEYNMYILLCICYIAEQNTCNLVLALPHKMSASNLYLHMYIVRSCNYDQGSHYS